MQFGAFWQLILLFGAVTIVNNFFYVKSDYLFGHRLPFTVHVIAHSLHLLFAREVCYQTDV